MKQPQSAVVSHTKFIHSYEASLNLLASVTQSRPSNLFRKCVLYIGGQYTVSTIGVPESQLYAYC